MALWRCPIGKDHFIPCTKNQLTACVVFHACFQGVVASCSWWCCANSHVPPGWMASVGEIEGPHWGYTCSPTTDTVPGGCTNAKIPTYILCALHFKPKNYLQKWLKEWEGNLLTCSQAIGKRLQDPNHYPRRSTSTCISFMCGGTMGRQSSCLGLQIYIQLKW